LVDLDAQVELEHAQGAIVEFRDTVRIQKQQIAEQEAKKFELLSSLTKAGNKQKTLQARHDGTVSKLRQTRCEYHSNVQRSVVSTAGFD